MGLPILGPESSRCILWLISIKDRLIFDPSFERKNSGIWVFQHNKIVEFDTHSVSNQSSAMDSMATLQWVVGPMSTPVKGGIFLRVKGHPSVRLVSRHCIILFFLSGTDFWKRNLRTFICIRIVLS